MYFSVGNCGKSGGFGVKKASPKTRKKEDRDFGLFDPPPGGGQIPPFLAPFWDPQNWPFLCIVGKIHLSSTEHACSSVYSSIRDQIHRKMGTHRERCRKESDLLYSRDDISAIHLPINFMDRNFIPETKYQDTPIYIFHYRNIPGDNEIFLTKRS